MLAKLDSLPLRLLASLSAPELSISVSIIILPSLITNTYFLYKIKKSRHWLTALRRGSKLCLFV
nr:MAG TPA_asm: hypothetical protein [Caudoviricetes sp.]